MIKNFTLALFIILSLFYVVLLVASGWQYEEHRVDISYKGVWIVEIALIRFINLLPVAVCATLMLVFSAFYVYEPGPFYKLAAPPVFFCLALSFIGFVLQEAYLPGSVGRNVEREQSTLYGRQNLEQAYRAQARGDVSGQMAGYRRYLELFPADTEVAALLDDLEVSLRQEQDQLSGLKNSQPTASVGDRLIGENPEKLLQEAMAYARKGDYYSAYYYSSLAYRLDVDFLQARDLAAGYYNSINELVAGAEEETSRQIFRQKLQGAEALVKNRPLKAYQIFQELENYYLNRKLPVGPDIKKYLEESQRAVASECYFSEDALVADSLPGVENLMFLNSVRPNYSELIYIGKLVSGRGLIMAKNVEIVRLGAGEQSRLHLLVPYAKLSNGKMLLSGYDRQTYEKIYQATFIEAEPAVANLASLPVNYSYRELILFRPDAVLESVYLSGLWNMSFEKSGSGFFSPIAQIEFVLRILYIFIFLEIVLISVVIGWNLRVKSRPPPMAGWLIILLLPLAVFLGHNLIKYSNRVVVSSILLNFGFIPTLIITLVVHVVLIVAGAFFVAAQRNEE